MQFTHQQLIGGHKYSSPAKIGNWQEELAIEESKQLDFERLVESNRKLRIKLGKCEKEVLRTFSPDGFIRFGDSISLKNDLSGANLVCDPCYPTEPGADQYLVSGSLGSIDAVARNTFHILRPPRHLKGVDDDDRDAILRMGQAFCVGCNSALLSSLCNSVLPPQLFLRSELKNERSSTKRNNRQAVCLSSENTADTIWTAVIASKGRANAANRFLSFGQPVTTRDSLQITHRQTNMYLTCDPSSIEMSNFGPEFQCYADRTVSSGKLHLLSSEFNGTSTPQTLEKPDSPRFGWHFVTSTDNAHSKPTNSFPLTEDRSIKLSHQVAIKLDETEV